MRLEYQCKSLVGVWPRDGDLTKNIKKIKMPQGGPQAGKKTSKFTIN